MVTNNIKMGWNPTETWLYSSKHEKSEFEIHTVGKLCIPPKSTLWVQAGVKLVTWLTVTDTNLSSTINRVKHEGP